MDPRHQTGKPQAAIFTRVTLQIYFPKVLIETLGFKIYVCKVSRNVTECRKEKVQEVVLFHP